MPGEAAKQDAASARRHLAFDNLLKKMMSVHFCMGFCPN
jgi:hypothetical protein